MGSTDSGRCEPRFARAISAPRGQFGTRFINEIIKTWREWSGKKTYAFSTTESVVLPWRSRKRAQRLVPTIRVNGKFVHNQQMPDLRTIAVLGIRANPEFRKDVVKDYSRIVYWPKWSNVPIRHTRYKEYQSYEKVAKSLHMERPRQMAGHFWIFRKSTIWLIHQQFVGSLMALDGDSFRKTNLRVVGTPYPRGIVCDCAYLGAKRLKVCPH